MKKTRICFAAASLVLSALVTGCSSDITPEQEASAAILEATNAASSAEASISLIMDARIGSAGSVDSHSASITSDITIESTADPSAYPDMPPPHVDGDTFTLKPLVHIWYRTAAVGDDAWAQFFTDMTIGLPESDIESGNHAYIRKNLMPSLGGYLPLQSEALCKAPAQSMRIRPDQANNSDTTIDA